MIGEAAAEKNGNNRRKTDRLTLIETNIDDVSPQILGYVMERAFELGALDCWFTAIQMKKNRPATLVSILCENERIDALTGLLYAETTTIGVRIAEVTRECLQREIKKVPTRFGEIDVKLARLNGETVNAKPEFDQLREIAERENLPLCEVESEAAKAVKSIWMGGSKARIESKRKIYRADKTVE
jgi:hypothetical protein